MVGSRLCVYGRGVEVSERVSVLYTPNCQRVIVLLLLFIFASREGLRDVYHILGHAHRRSKATLRLSAAATTAAPTFSATLPSLRCLRLIFSPSLSNSVFS